MKKSLFVLIAFIFISGVAMATEEPKYKVLSKTDQYEIRSYGEVIVAQTKINSSFDEAGNKAFRILADFIFGNNKSKTKIAMTAPVTQAAVSEKIAMTAPVSQEKAQDGYWVQFTMPENYTLATLPQPNDTRVEIKTIPARFVAVFSYSGSWSEERFNEKRVEFLSALKKDNVVTKGEVSFARYNSPMQIWFLRRNEIWVEVAR